MTALHLLGLPLEVQRIIYQKLYENCLPLAPGYDGSRRSGGRSISLLLTSRHMYCEARPYYRQACTALDLTACDRDVAGDTVEKLGRHGKQQAQAWLREILCEVAVDACSFRRFDAICRLPSIKKLTIYASTCYYYARKKSTAEFLGDFDRAVPRRMLEEEEEPYLYTAYSALPGIKLVVLWVGRVTTYDARIQMVMCRHSSTFIRFLTPNAGLRLRGQSCGRADPVRKYQRNGPRRRYRYHCYL